MGGEEILLSGGAVVMISHSDWQLGGEGVEILLSDMYLLRLRVRQSW